MFMFSVYPSSESLCGQALGLTGELWKKHKTVTTMCKQENPGKEAHSGKGGSSLSLLALWGWKSFNLTSSELMQTTNPDCRI